MTWHLAIGLAGGWAFTALYYRTIKPWYLRKSHQDLFDLSTGR